MSEYKKILKLPGNIYFTEAKYEKKILGWLAKAVSVNPEDKELTDFFPELISEKKGFLESNGEVFDGVQNELIYATNFACFFRTDPNEWRLTNTFDYYRPEIILKKKLNEKISRCFIRTTRPEKILDWNIEEEINKTNYNQKEKKIHDKILTKSKELLIIGIDEGSYDSANGSRLSECTFSVPFEETVIYECYDESYEVNASNEKKYLQLDKEEGVYRYQKKFDILKPNIHFLYFDCIYE